MIEKLKDISLFLASKSPRRKQLMEESGLPFTVIDVDVEESYSEELPLQEVPEYLAFKKAKAGLAALDKNGIIIAADCVVLFENQILEKPKSRQEAINMIAMMSGNSHLVISGVCLINSTKHRIFKVTTKVDFGELSAEEIIYYVDQYQPFDKAGSYGIQEWIGHCKVKRIEGSYTNVMGLPMYELYHELIQFIES